MEKHSVSACEVLMHGVRDKESHEGHNRRKSVAIIYTMAFETTTMPLHCYQLVGTDRRVPK